MEWKTIIYNDKYEVSNTGLVRRKDSGHIHSGCIAQGYRSIKLTFENSIQKRYKSHRLVAEHFIVNDDPKNKTIVHHKNGDKLDNRVENLEWVTPRQNNLYYYQNQIQAVKNKRRYNSKPIPVKQFTLNNQLINSFPSINSASKATGISVAHISRCVHGEVLSAGGFIFKQMEGSTTKSSKNP